MTKSLADVCEQMSPLSEGPASSAFSGRSQGPESRTPSHAAAPTGPFGMPWESSLVRSSPPGSPKQL